MQSKEKTIKYWLITDTHFNHEVLKQYCGRPDDVDEIIKRNLMNYVKEGDVLIHLGDLCIGNDKANSEWFRNLKSRNILVRGNHDRKSHNWYMQNGWDLCVDRFDLEMFGKKIAFTHMPVGWDGYFDLNIHGHFHNANHRRYEADLKKVLNGYHKLLALEYTNYMPILLNKFIN